MKNNKVYNVLVIIILVLVLVGASYLGRSITDRQKKAKEASNNKEVLSDFSLNGFTCHDRFKYFVITRPDLSLNAGDDILVKYKLNQGENKINCDYEVKEGDFQLLNTPIEGSSLSQHFSDINENLLIIDEGTGIDRNLKIYDLEKKEKVFSDTYSSSFALEDGMLTYWHKTNDIPSTVNCSRLYEYMKSYGGAKIEGKISLDLSNIKDREYSEFRCSPIE